MNDLPINGVRHGWYIWCGISCKGLIIHIYLIRCDSDLRINGVRHGWDICFSISCAAAIFERIFSRGLFSTPCMLSEAEGRYPGGCGRHVTGTWWDAHDPLLRPVGLWSGILGWTMWCWLGVCSFWRWVLGFCLEKCFSSLSDTLVYVKISSKCGVCDFSLRGDYSKVWLQEWL